MREVDISDIPHIITILQSYYGEELMVGMEYNLSNKIRDKFNNTILIDPNLSMVLFVERIGNFKCQLHIYTIPKVRGREVKRFFKQSIQYIITNRNYLLFFTFVPVDNPAADMAARVVGFKSVTSFKDAGGINKEEVLYSMSKQDFINRED